MSRPDLNLLVTLDVLLAEGSVARAASRLRLSPSAMSRALARLRAATGDPLLVRAGRGLVPTPRALELRQRVGPLVDAAETVLRPAAVLNPAEFARTFTLRTREGFVETFGAALLARMAAEAPRVRLHFVQKLDKDSAALRDGLIDLETGVVSKDTGPEIRAQALFRDRFVGVVRQSHPLSRGPVTAERYSAAQHVAVARRTLDESPLEGPLKSPRLQRQVATMVSGFATALALARVTDLIATVPERHTAGLREGMVSFPLPFRAPELTVSLLWHPRLHADPAHRWLRECLREICGTANER